MSDRLTDAELDELDRLYREWMDTPAGSISYLAFRNAAVPTARPLIDEVRELRRAIRVAREQHVEVMAENATLRAYARHRPSCPAALGEEYPCDCGWREIEGRKEGE